MKRPAPWLVYSRRERAWLERDRGGWRRANIRIADRFSDEQRDALDLGPHEEAVAVGSPRYWDLAVLVIAREIEEAVFAHEQIGAEAAHRARFRPDTNPAVRFKEAVAAMLAPARFILE